jgi:NitT/TauT family transport system substrate-binding protein
MRKGRSIASAVRGNVAHASTNFFATAIAAAIGSLVLTFAPGGQGSALAQAAKPKLDVAGSPTWLGQVPVMVALEKGYFKDAGLDVEFKLILNSGDRIRALSAGDIAWSNLGRLAVITEMARGNTSFYYFANIDDSPGNEGCWARPGIGSFKDLKGKKIAANTSAEITMHGLLQEAGMTVKDVQYLNLPPNEMAGAISKGDIDAACIWQPLLNGVKNAAPGGKLLGLDSDTTMGKKYKTMASPDIVIISKKVVDENPAAAGKLALAILKGADYAIANQADTAKTVANYFKKEPAELEASLNSFQYYGTKGWQEHMKVHSQQMQDLADWLYENKKIDNKIDVTKWEKTSFIPQ